MASGGTNGLKKEFEGLQDRTQNEGMMTEHFPLNFPALFRASLSMTNINYNRNNIVSTFLLFTAVVVVCLNTAA